MGSWSLGLLVYMTGLSWNYCLSEQIGVGQLLGELIAVRKMRFNSMRPGPRCEASSLTHTRCGPSPAITIKYYAFYAVITLRFSAGTRFMTRIAVFDSWNCRLFFRLTACSIDRHEASTASKAYPRMACSYS